MTGRLIGAVRAVETVRLEAGTGAFPKKVDAIEAALWRNKAAPRLDVHTVKPAVRGRPPRLARPHPRRRRLADRAQRLGRARPDELRANRA